jgi:hypothetical protein
MLNKKKSQYLKSPPIALWKYKYILQLTQKWMITRSPGKNESPTFLSYDLNCTENKTWSGGYTDTRTDGKVIS